MPDIESRIDELYQGPLDQFIASRNALARSLKPPDAQRVRALQKPTLVPWVVNQVYWHARGLYDQLMRAGEKLRAAQVAALEGRAADLRAATQAHRDAIAKVTAKASEIAAAADASPGADEIVRTFEALSLSRTPDDHPGRLTTALAPAGFEALGGIAVKTAASPPGASGTTAARSSHRIDPRGEAAGRRAQKALEEKQAAAARERAAAMKKAQAAVDRARAAELQAREDWHRAKRALDAAERAIALLE